jgi:hypothetical protein
VLKPLWSWPNVLSRWKSAQRYHYKYLDGRNDY